MDKSDGHLKEIQSFGDTKAGVKGLVDAGVTSIPKIFIWPAEELMEESKIGPTQLKIPVVDLRGINGDPKSKTAVIDEIVRASEEWGLFHVTNHGIPQSVLDGMIDGTRKFHEQDPEVKTQFYSRDPLKMVRYNSDIYQDHLRVASWKDTVIINLAVFNQFEPDELPEVCRSTVTDYINHVTKLGDVLFELLSEALGLKQESLNAMGYAKSRSFTLHYYPACPEPDKTRGTRRHTDPSFLTILLQNQIGGLQVLHKNRWMDVLPISGSLTVNIGDFLQIISNDRFKSAEHRVLANITGPRIAVASFFAGVVIPPKIYGPIKELISEERPAIYKEFTVPEYFKSYLSGSTDRSGLDIWKI